MAAPKKPPKATLDLAYGALPKAAKQRTPQEKAAIRKTRAWRLRRKPGTPTKGGWTNVPAPNLQEQAESLVGAEFDPALDALKAEIARYGGQVQQGMGGIQGAYQGVMPYLGAIGPQVQSGYQEAADSSALFAKGFSDGMAQIAQGQASQDAAFLGSIGAPQAQIDQLQQNVAGGAALGADVLYGLGGYIPGQALGHEGAAAGAAASRMPAVAAGYMNDSLADLQAASNRQQGAFSTQVADLERQRGEAIKSTLLELQTQRRSEQEDRRRWEAEFRVQLEAAKLAARQMGLSEDAFEWDKYMDEQGVALNWADLEASAAADAASAAEDAAGARAAAIEDRQDYLNRVGNNMTKAYNALVKELNQSTSGGQPDRLGAPGAAPAGGAQRKPTYQKAFKRLYTTLKAQHGTGKGKWRYGVKDSTIRQKIRRYLVGLGIKPPPRNNPAGVLDPDRQFGPTLL